LYWIAAGSLGSLEATVVVRNCCHDSSSGNAGR
jgi:hypothetical protein